MKPMESLSDPRPLSIPIDREGLIVRPEDSLQRVIASIDQNQTGSVLVLDSSKRLKDVITDGDIRRALLAGICLEAPVRLLQKRRSTSPYPKPVTAPWNATTNDLYRLMRKKQVLQVPLLDRRGFVVGVAIAGDLIHHDKQGFQAVVMAGGFGKRLSRLTRKTPKPMLPIGKRPLLERILKQLKEAGIHRIHVTTHYRSEKIIQYIGDGEHWGLNVNYLQESQPQGTAGSLRRLKGLGPFLVVNGDILTQVDYRAMARFHNEVKPIMTVGVRRYETSIPFGVIQLDGDRVKSFSEKPVIQNHIYAGICLLNAKALSFIPKRRRFEMPDLIRILLRKGKKVAGFPIHESWMDIGTPQSYRLAKEAFKENIRFQRQGPVVPGTGT